MGSEPTPRVLRYDSPQAFEKAIVDQSREGYRLHSWHTAREVLQQYERVGEVVLGSEIGATVFYALFVPMPPEVTPPAVLPLMAR